MSAKQAGPPSTKGVSVVEAQKLLAEFLDGTPLYTPLEVALSDAATIDDIAPRAFSRSCPACRSQTTWTTSSSSDFRYGAPSLQCAQCKSATIEFRVRIEPDPHGPMHPAAVSISSRGGPTRPLTRSKKWTIRKWGQWPAWSITPPREVQDALGKDELDLYKKALICISQSFGVGALAYFRRVVENSMTAMLDLVEEAARADRDDEALRNVERARASKRADEKLALIVEHVPPTLRPGGVNPLAVLHDLYSKGLHSLSDVECVSVALELRRSFDFVFRRLRQLAREAKEYAAEITALAGKKGSDLK